MARATKKRGHKGDILTSRHGEASGNAWWGENANGATAAAVETGDGGDTVMGSSDGLETTDGGFVLLDGDTETTDGDGFLLLDDGGETTDDDGFLLLNRPVLRSNL